MAILPSGNICQDDLREDVGGRVPHPAQPFGLVDIVLSGDAAAIAVIQRKFGIERVVGHRGRIRVESGGRYWT